MNTRAELRFIAAESEKPSYTMMLGSEPPKKTGMFLTKFVLINNARLQVTAPTLDANGFELVTSSTAMDEDILDAEVSDIGYDEVTAALLRATGARKVIIFDHTIRNSSTSNGERGVASHVHVDYTPASFTAKLQSLGISCEGQRIAQINAWRPLKEPVEVAPLALLDCQSMHNNDLVPCDLIYPDRKGEIYELTHSLDHRWFYYPKMMRNELLLFKGYDSADLEQLSISPHTAFSHPKETPDLPARRSVEFRTAVIY